MRNKIMFTLQGYFARSNSLFREMIVLEKLIVVLFHSSDFRDWRENCLFSSHAKNVSQHARIKSLVGNNHHAKDSRESCILGDLGATSQDDAIFSGERHFWCESLL